MDEVNIGQGYSGASTLDLHWGLGWSPSVDSLEVRWPSGEITMHHELAINTRHEIWEPTNCLADFDYDFARSSGDLLVLLSGFGQFGTPTDLDGDGVVAASDLLVFLTVFGTSCN